jgi:hypothetical protein
MTYNNLIKLNKVIKPSNSNKFIFIIGRYMTSNKNNDQYNTPSYLNNYCQNDCDEKNCSNNEKCKKNIDDDDISGWGFANGSYGYGLKSFFPLVNHFNYFDVSVPNGIINPMESLDSDTMSYNINNSNNNNFSADFDGQTNNQTNNQTNIEANMTSDMFESVSEVTTTIIDTGSSVVETIGDIIIDTGISVVDTIEDAVDVVSDILDD